MARTRKKRRTEEQVREMALDLAKEGPFAPADLAEKAGFSGNRARQILEGLGEKKKLTILGLRKSPRGKPANLWGFPGTKVSEADKQPRPRSSAKKAVIAKKPRIASVASVRAPVRVTSMLDQGLVSSLRRVLDRLSVHGFEVQGPAGLTFSVRLGGTEGVRTPGVRRVGKTRRRRGTGTGRKAAASGEAAADNRKGRRVAADEAQSSAAPN